MRSRQAGMSSAPRVGTGRGLYIRGNQKRLDRNYGRLEGGKEATRQEQHCFQNPAVELRHDRKYHGNFPIFSSMVHGSYLRRPGAQGNAWVNIGNQSHASQSARKSKETQTMAASFLPQRGHTCTSIVLKA